MSFTPDIPSTEDVLTVALSPTLPPLPPQESHVGATTVSWWEMDPGEVYIHAEGGTMDDRHYAATLVGIQLEPHGYKRAQFDMDSGGGAPDIGDYITTRDGFTFEVVDMTENTLTGIPEYIVRADLDGNDMARSQGEEGVDWSYVYIPANEITNPGSLKQTEDQDVEHPDPGRYTSQRTAAWPDLMAKAKRLIQSGQVQVLRNGFNNIMGHIIGDHGEYDTEISRDDPSSRSITGWQCSCPWDQYAWQRTRKWKKFEGRPCSHVMALYWKALSTPLDEQLSEQQATGMGTGQKLPGAPQGHPDTHEFNLPHSVGPHGEVIQGDQQKLGLPPEASGGPPGPAQAPLAPPPGQGPSGPQPAGILPPFPGEQMEMQWAGPGTTPGGGVSPPGAYTVPGAKPQTPANPVQNPSTYSHIAGMTLPQQQRAWAQLKEEYPHQPNVLWQDPEGWTVQEHNEPNAVAAVGRMMSNCWQNATTPRGMADNLQVQMDNPQNATYRALHDPQGIPRVGFYWQPNQITLPMGHGVNDPKPEHAQRLWQWAKSLPQMPTTDGYSMEQGWPNYSPATEGWPKFVRRNRLGATFQAPQVVRLKNPVLGVAEGPVQGQYGDGEYREIPAGTKGEVLSQDATTGWVEAIFALDDSGPHEPFHVKCFVESSDIEETGESNAFVQRHSSDSSA